MPKKDTAALLLTCLAGVVYDVSGLLDNTRDAPSAPITSISDAVDREERPDPPQAFSAVSPAQHRDDELPWKTITGEGHFVIPVPGVSGSAVTGEGHFLIPVPGG